MAIITDIFKDGVYWLEVECGSQNIEHYENVGYEIPRKKDNNGIMRVTRGTKILVKLDDLTNGSGEYVLKICDMCGRKTENQPYVRILTQRKNGDGIDKCDSCRVVAIKENVPFEKSLEYKFPEIAKTWHPTLNGDLIPDKIHANSTFKYWWLCPNCDSDYDMSAQKRVNGCNCPYCVGQRVNHTNNLWKVAPDIAKLLWNPEDGHINTSGTIKKVDFRCPNCNEKIQNKKIANVVKSGLFCIKCSDGISFPEKMMINVLMQLGIEFEFQKMFSWSKKAIHNNNKLSGRKFYDFYLNKINCIIEVHGLQHYDNVNYEKIGGRSLEEEKENDTIKEFLANQNGINNYIVIDCSKSDAAYIKNNIVESKLSTLFDLNIIDWLKCHEYSCNSFVKIACDLWNTKIGVKQIGEKLNLSSSTVVKYLKQGSQFGWCDYDPKEEKRMNSVINGSKRKDKSGKPVIQLTLKNNYVDSFASANSAGRKLSIASSSISSVCNKKRKTAGGFKWIFKSDYERIIERGVI